MDPQPCQPQLPAQRAARDQVSRAWEARGWWGREGGGQSKGLGGVPASGGPRLGTWPGLSGPHSPSSPLTAPQALWLLMAPGGPWAPGLGQCKEKGPLWGGGGFQGAWRLPYLPCLTPPHGSPHTAHSLSSDSTGSDKEARASEIPPWLEGRGEHSSGGVGGQRGEQEMGWGEPLGDCTEWGLLAGWGEVGSTGRTK